MDLRGRTPMERGVGRSERRAAKAIEQGYTAGHSEPYHGYMFKILKGQGPQRHWENWTTL